MKRWIPLLSVVLLLSAVPAFADHCWYCDFNDECQVGAPVGGAGCRIRNPGQPNQFCEELGFCNDWGLAARSFNADWKVTNVSVLTPNGPDAPRRADSAVITVADSLKPVLTER